MPSYLRFASPVLAVTLLFACVAAAQEKELTAEEVVARHLQSIGAAELRTSFQRRAAEGVAQFSMLQGGTAKMSGRAALATSEGKLRVGMQFATVDYPGEQWVSDGSRVAIAQSGPSRRSALGDFLYRQQEMMREGLWGGTLSTAWPLLRLKESGARVKFDGIKKLGERELLRLTYQPKKKTDLEIRLFFDPQTFQHVATSYYLEVQPTMGRSQTVRGESVRYEVVETFDQMQPLDGLNLPRHWNIRYSVFPVRSQILEWDLQLPRMSHQVNFPPEAFSPEAAR